MTPLLQEKFNTNYVPTSVEIKLIEHELAKSKEQLSLLDTEIGRLQDRCNQLSVDKEHLSIGVAKARGMLAPARQLIPEILREIFCHCLPISHNAVMSSLEAPLLLGRVCSYWRQIAYATPRLWTSLHIVIPSTGPYDPLPADNTLILAAVSQWLARSGVLPLSISMISRHSLLPTNGHIRPFLDLLNPYARRWRSISFRFEWYAWAELFNLYRAEDVPLLETVDFDGCQFTESVGQGDFGAATRENGFLYAPRLCSLSLPRFAPEILQLPVKWSELLELNLSHGSFSLQDILAALKRCTELRKCSISLPNATTSEGYAEAGLPASKIIMPKLEVLALIKGHSQEDMRIVLETLTTPQLCHLSYQQPFTSLGWDQSYHEQHLVEALKTFLCNLIEPLRELELDAGGLLFDSVIGILGMVPDLERLSIVSCRGVEDVSPPSGLWTPASHSPFTNQALRRFIPRVLTVQHQNASPVPQTSEGVVDNCIDDDSNYFPPADEPVERLLSGQHVLSYSKNKVIVGRLCPKLKVVDFRGAMFSESTFLEFLRARSLRHQELDVAHLKSVNVVYVPGIKSNENFTNRVLKLGKLTGIRVYLTYENPLILPAVTDILRHPENMIVPPTHLGF